MLLTVNTGSSSVRLALYEGGTNSLRPCGEARHDAGAADAAVQLQQFLREHASERPALVAHRVVHGGADLTAATRIDPGVESAIERCSVLAPLHNPAALAWIRLCREVLGDDTPQVAVFDTAFYADLPAVAATYALPRQLAERHRLRRYGFHGIAHQALWSRWRELQPDVADGGRVISFQLGAGCSVTAIRNGQPRDTSMGFSPLEGLVMATRCGDVDPGLLLHLQRTEAMTPQHLESLLNEQSGLLGVSAVSADMQRLLETDDPRARLAVDLFCYRARKYLGAYLAVLGGADAVIFGGGIGEGAPSVRAAVLDGLGWAGIQVDPHANAVAVGREARISSTRSSAQVWVIPVDEARVLARQALAVASQWSHRHGAWT